MWEFLVKKTCAQLIKLLAGWFQIYPLWTIFCGENAMSTLDQVESTSSKCSQIESTLEKKIAAGSSVQATTINFSVQICIPTTTAVQTKHVLGLPIVQCFYPSFASIAETRIQVNHEHGRFKTRTQCCRWSTRPRREHAGWRYGCWSIKKSWGRKITAGHVSFWTI